MTQSSKGFAQHKFAIPRLSVHPSHTDHPIPQAAAEDSPAAVPLSLPHSSSDTTTSSSQHTNAETSSPVTHPLIRSAIPAQEAVFPSASPVAAVPASTRSITQKEIQGAAPPVVAEAVPGVTGQEITAVEGTETAIEKPEKLKQFVTFLNGENPGACMFHAQMRLSVEGCIKLANFLKESHRVRALSLSHNYLGE